ncbi:hypothetical protein X888_4937 [Burkholderia pseudomallei MSHR4377]|nr:subfamily M23B unassigned peptidase domain protein [Burkholderia pseudomallei NAU35A-3]AJX91256.1 hypothetical protein BH02_3893 [Burkholderia pseudomallei]KGV00266.1 hypothetical protein X888_4937 [Burkholderia pseudomallei MSHR4377]
MAAVRDALTGRGRFIGLGAARVAGSRRAAWPSCRIARPVT